MTDQDKAFQILNQLQALINASNIPNHGVQIGIPPFTDKTAYKIDFKDEATEEQRTQGQAIIDNFVFKESKTYTPFAFMNLFTQEEQNAIENSTDSGVKIFLRKMSLVSEVITDYPDTITGMNYLVEKGLITEARKIEILA